METEYSAEDIVAYHDVLAIQNSEHHRLKMVTIGRRSKDANKGRSLGKGYYLRLDEVENPIIEFRSAPPVFFSFSGEAYCWRNGLSFKTILLS